MSNFNCKIILSKYLIVYLYYFLRNHHVPKTQHPDTYTKNEALTKQNIKN
jgi:hypothetical protein